MSTGQAFYHTVKADLLERIRSYGFLIVLLLTLLAAYIFVPSTDAGYMTIKLSSDTGLYRGIYNSAWIGAMVSLPTTLFLSLFGFYVIKNAVGRDRSTGVGQIIATTPLSKPLYMLGKATSNFAVLAVIVGIMMAGTLVMQLLRGEVSSIDLLALWSPFIFLVLPAMAVVASVAVLFESVSFLSGGIGNIVYFIVYMIVLAILLTSAGSALPNNDLAYLSDMFGTSIATSSLQVAAHAAYPSFVPGHWSMGFAPVDRPPGLFTWNGIQWTPLIILGRLFWVIVAGGLALVASVFFDRFDSSINVTKKSRKAVVEAKPSGDMPAEKALTQVRLTPLSFNKKYVNPASLLLAEMRLAFKGQRWWWYAGALIIILLGLSSSGADGQHMAVLAAMIWPILIWSAMSTRERTFNTGQIVFSAPGPVNYQLPMMWLAGILAGVALSSGVLASMAISGNYIDMWTLLAEMMLIPAMAMAMGIWSGSSKLFEASYMILWYIGPVNNLPFLDITGTVAKTMNMGLPIAYLLMTIAFLAIMAVGRRKQVYD